MKFLKFFFFLSITLLFINGNIFAQALSGTKTIGATGSDYATFTLAAKDLNTKGVNGKLTFKIKSGTYSEKFTIKKVPGASVSNNITFESETGIPNDVIITSLGPNTAGRLGTVNLDGAENINFKNIRINSTAQEIGSCVQLKTSCFNISFDNCKFEILADDNGGGNSCITAADSNQCPTTLTTVGLTVDNLSIRNCTLTGGSYGIIIAGKTSVGRNIIENNTFLNQTAYGIYLASNNENIIYKNNITMDPNGVGMYGIYLFSSSKNSISHNYIKAADAYGMYLSGGSNNIVFNNMLAGGYARRGTVGYCIYINAVGNKFYYNSAIYDASSGTSAGLLSSVVYLSGSKNDFYNNNFVNTGGGYVYYVSGGKEVFGKMDNNNLFASTGGFISHFTSPVADYDFNQHKTYSKLETNSVNVNPKFAANFDLHLKVDNGNKLLDGTGTAIESVVFDYDNEARNAMGPDIGMDEFDLIYDKFEIALTDINPKTLIIGDQPLTVKILNRGQTSLKDSIIKMSYSLNGGSTWSTEETVKLQGLDKTHFYEYYTFKNLANFPAPGLYNVCVKINSVGKIPDVLLTNNTICNSLCVGLNKSLFTIGSTASDFVKVQDAVNMLAALPCGILTPIVFNIKSGTYTEQIAIPFIEGVSEINTITFQSATGKASDVIITFNNNNQEPFHTLLLDGAKYVQIKNITVVNTNNTSSKTIHLISDASFNLIKGCIVKADTTYANVISDGGLNTIHSASGSVNDNVIDSNIIFGGIYGFVFTGGNRNSITRNTITNAALYGANIGGFSLNFTDNKLQTRGHYGLYVNSLNKSLVSRNYIRAAMGSVPTSPASTVYYGVYMFGVRTEFSSNSVIVGDGSRSVNAAYGFYTGSNSSVKVYNNSIVTNFAKVAQTNYVFYAPAATQTLKNELINNVFFNNSDGGPVVFAAPGNVSISNHNNFYTKGAALINWNGISYPTLSSFQTATGMDKNSVSITPAFISNLNNLHTANPGLNAKGTPTIVSYDIDGEFRNPYTPDIGADEFVIEVTDLGILDFAPKKFKFGKNDLEVELINLGNGSLAGKSMQFSVSADSGKTWSAPINYTIVGLTNYNAREKAVLKDAVNGESLEPFDLCVRIEPGSLAGDLITLNETACDKVCVEFGAGTYTVGANNADFPDFKTLTDLLELAVCKAPGDITINVQSGTYNEAVSFVLHTGDSITGNITVQSLSGRAEDVIVNAGTAVGQTSTFNADSVKGFILKNLTIRNTGNSNAQGVSVNNSQNFRMEGCKVEVDSIAVSSGITAVNINNVSGINIENNKISGGENGIAISLGGSLLKTKILNNYISASNSYGITTDEVPVSEINNNTVIMRAGNDFGIGISLVDLSTNYTINANKVYNAAFSCLMLEGTAYNGLMSNNMLGGGFFQGLVGSGLYLSKVENIKIYHNSVNYDGNAQAGKALFLKQCSNVLMKNNIFSSSGKGYAYFIDTESQIISDYNDLYTGGTKLASVGGADQTFDQLKSSGQEINSISSNPDYASATDLHVFNSLIDNKGTFVSEVQKDFDAQNRSTSTPDIGADEFTLGLDGGVSTVVFSNSTPKINEAQNVTATISNIGNANLINFSASYSVNGTLQATENITANIPVGGKIDYTFLKSYTPTADGKYIVCAKTIINNDVNSSNDETCKEYQIKTIGIEENVFRSIKIYPNPATHYITIEGLPDNQNIEIYDMLGSLKIKLDNHQQEKIEININSLSGGLYNVRIINNEQNKVDNYRPKNNLFIKQ